MDTDRHRFGDRMEDREEFENKLKLLKIEGKRNIIDIISGYQKLLSIVEKGLLPKETYTFSYEEEGERQMSSDHFIEVVKVINKIKNIPESINFFEVLTDREIDLLLSQVASHLKALQGLAYYLYNCYYASELWDALQFSAFDYLDINSHPLALAKLSIEDIRYRPNKHE